MRRDKMPNMTIEQIKMLFAQTVLTMFSIFTTVITIMILSIPFYYAWNYFAPLYLTPYIPSSFLVFSYWAVVSFSIMCNFIGNLIEKITPKFISISN